MYTQALQSGGGVAQRLNQHFNKAIRVWDLSANTVLSIRRGLFFILKTETARAATPHERGKSISGFFPELLHKPFAIGRYMWYTLSITLITKREKLC